jgi:hypothetical protein
MMRYESNKPHGRRRTDKQLPAEERSRLQSIRQDVEEDDTGTLRRYLRLAKKLLEPDSNSPLDSSSYPKTDV